MRKKITELTAKLTANREKIEARQTQILKCLDPKNRDRFCRNGRPHGGWTVPGVAAWTRAVKCTPGLRTDCFWSGSNPTPSTQYAEAVFEFLRKIDPDRWYPDQYDPAAWGEED